MGTVAREVRVHGRVQGVFFRDSTRQRARRAGVSGWVRNAADGTVHAWLEGPPESVDGIIGWMRRGGPPSARVERVEERRATAQGFDTFEVRH